MRKLKSNEKFGQLAGHQTIEKTIEALISNGIDALVVKNGQAARKKVLEMLPQKAQVMNMTSQTLEVLKIPKDLQESGRFVSIRNKLNSMDRNTQGKEMRRLGSVPDFAIGSVHAVTQDGQVLIASNTGSQLPAYVYGAGRVIWVVGSQKIVKNLEEGMARIYEYCLPLENVRAQEAYGRGSNVNKILIINKEIVPGRITLIFVKEKLGF